VDERSEELAALNALDMLESDEKRVLHGACVTDKDLRSFSAELGVVAAELGRLVAPLQPPADMKRRIRAKIRSRGGRMASISPGVMIGALGWGLAAALAAASVWLWNERGKLERELANASDVIAKVLPAADTNKGQVRTLEETLKNMRDDFEQKQASLNTEIDTLRKRETEAQARIAQLVAEAEAMKKQDAQSQLRISSVQSEIWEYRRAEMIVVWDARRKQGALLLDKMPKVEAGKDYQLWIVDPKQPEAVSAGVVSVDDKGAAKIAFKPAADVGDTVKFAISVEKKGGAEKKEGPVVLTGP
jgi:anti-sigma-K factor RskA